jgi:hypothetical protein
MKREEMMAYSSSSLTNVKATSEESRFSCFDLGAGYLFHTSFL